MNAPIARQHLIDPEICIRCNTCEETCPVDAVTHDSRNYVVSFETCNGCMACVPPCPTGAIDNWRNVIVAKAYSVDQQFGWDALPATSELDSQVVPNAADLPADVQELTRIATAGQGAALPPRSAAQPVVNLYTPSTPATATVTGNFRLTAVDATSDIRHIVLDFGTLPFPVLEGQSIGIVAPGTDASGRAHHVRMYSIASPRDGERPRYNNVALTVKRVTEDHAGQVVRGVCSNYLCDLPRGATVQVVGPYGETFLMPNSAGTSVMMICTGTGSAPMRAMTERRRRRRALAEGGDLLLFFGARSPDELPYFGPLQKLPADFIDINFAFSRQPGEPKRYVQDRIRERADVVAHWLAEQRCHVYVCGLKGMEAGVLEAFSDACRAHGLDWEQLRPQLLSEGRLHIETY